MSQNALTNILLLSARIKQIIIALHQGSNVRLSINDQVIISVRVSLDILSKPKLFYGINVQELTIRTLGIDRQMSMIARHHKLSSLQDEH